VILLGIILIAGSAAFTGLAIAYNLGGGPEYVVRMLGHNIVTMNTLAIFCAGLALALIFAFGLWLVSVGGRFHARRRTETPMTGYTDTYPDGSPRLVEAPPETTARHRRP
jgi:hypothetical protein